MRVALQEGATVILYRIDLLTYMNMFCHRNVPKQHFLDYSKQQTGLLSNITDQWRYITSNQFMIVHAIFKIYTISAVMFLVYMEVIFKLFLIL